MPTSFFIAFLLFSLDSSLLAAEKSASALPIPCVWMQVFKAKLTRRLLKQSPAHGLSAMGRRDMRKPAIDDIRFGGGFCDRSSGLGPTAATDHLIVKGILGRRFDWGRGSSVD